MKRVRLLSKDQGVAARGGRDYIIHNAECKQNL